MEIFVFAGDIAEAKADALCTSTNPRLSLVMGSGAAVRARGGFQILRESEAIAAGRLLPAGSAHVTTAGELPHRIVIHCVASNEAHRSSPGIVAACVRNALARAEAAGCRSIAMPVFASGHAGMKFLSALETIIDTLQRSETAIERVVIAVDDAERAAEASAMVARAAQNIAMSATAGGVRCVITLA
jgi:O-acetyl-ADP-ribose deacetylase (regulator of RNase III)